MEEDAGRGKRDNQRITAALSSQNLTFLRAYARVGGLTFLHIGHLPHPYARVARRATGATPKKWHATSLHADWLAVRYAELIRMEVDMTEHPRPLIGDLFRLVREAEGEE